MGILSNKITQVFFPFFFLYIEGKKTLDRSFRKKQCG